MYSTANFLLHDQQAQLSQRLRAQRSVSLKQLLEEYRDLEIYVRGHWTSQEMAPFNRSHTSSF